MNNLLDGSALLPTQPPDDSTAADLYQKWDTASPEEQATIRPQLQAYADAQDATANAAKNLKWQQIYSDPKTLGGHISAIKDDQALTHSTTPDETTAGAANMAYLSDTTGKSMDELAQNWPSIRSGYALQNHGQDVKSDTELFGLISQDVARKKASSDAIGKLPGDAVVQAFQDVVTGKDTSTLDTFNAWKEQHPDIVKDYPEATLHQLYTDLYEKTAQVIAPLAPQAKAIFESLAKDTGRPDAPESAIDPAQLASQIQDLPIAQRQALYTVASAYAERTGQPKGFWQQIAQSIGRSVTGTVGSVSLAAKQNEIEGQLDLLKNDQAALMPDGSIIPVDGAKTQTAQAFTTPTDDQKAQLTSQLQEQLKGIKTVRELNSLASQQIDPIKPVVDWMPHALEKGLYGAAGSLPLIGASLLQPEVGIPAIGASIFGQEFDRISLAYPNLPTSQVNTMAALSAAPQTALMELRAGAILGKLPVLGKYLERLGNPQMNPFLRGAINTVGQSAEQGTMVMAQSAVPLMVDGMAKAAGADMPEYDLGKALEAYKDSTPEILFSVLPFALIGAVLATHSDMRRADAMTKSAQNLLEMGYSQAEADRISKIEDPAARNAEVKATWNDRKSEDIHAGIQMIQDRIQGEVKNQADPATPTLKTEDEMVNGQPTGNKVYTVLDELGNQKIQTTDPDAARQYYQTAIEDAASNERFHLKSLVDYFQGLDQTQGRERTYTLDTKTVTGADEVAAGQSPEQIKERMEQEGIQGGLPLDQVIIRGKTIPDFSRQIYSDTIHILDGQAGTLFHERLDGEVMAAIHEGRISQDQFLEWCRQTEAATGEKWLPEIPEGSTHSAQQIREAVTKIGEAYLVGRIRKIQQIAPGLRGIVRSIMEYFRHVLAKAKVLKEAIDAGKIDSNFHSFLAKSVGLPEADMVEQHAANATRETVRGMEQGAPETSYSLRTRGGRFDKEKEREQNARINELDERLFGSTQRTSTSVDSTASAKAYLQGGNGTSGGSASGKTEIREWAEREGRLVNKLPWKLDGPKDKGGGEHHAFFDEKSGRWVKVTKGSGDSFGRTLDLRGKKWSIGRSTALEYLDRISDENEAFHDDIVFHGVYEDKHGNVNMITSQPDMKGDPVKDAEEIQKHMEESGFYSMGHSGYYRASDNTLVLDLHRENAVVAKDGFLDVFDAITLHPTEEQFARLRKEGAIPERSSDSSLTETGRPTANDPKDGARSVATEPAPTHQLPDGSQIQGPTSYSIGVLHGSPYEFDRFSTDKIGTGDGGQAHGWGIYFSQNPHEASIYRYGANSGTGLIKGKPIRDIWTKYILSASKWNLERAREVAQATAEGKLTPEMETAFKSIPKQLQGEAKKAADSLGKINQEDISAPASGHLYTAELLPNHEDFLQWDKPMSEQSKQVKEAIQRLHELPRWKDDPLAKELLNRENVDGSAIYQTIAGGYAEHRGLEQASKDLLEAGIPGLSYENGNTGEGGKHNYVLFDPNLAKIIERNGEPVQPIETREQGEVHRNAVEGRYQRACDEIAAAKKKADQSISVSRNGLSNADISFEHYPEEYGSLEFWEPSIASDKWHGDNSDYRITKHEGNYFVGESSKKFKTLEDAQEAAREDILEELQDQSDQFGADMVNKEAVSDMFYSFPSELGGFQSKGGWFSTKWGSWYLEGTIDGNPIKLSIRDHEPSRKDMGHPDKWWEVSKQWTPGEVEDALKRALTWIHEKANPDAISDTGAAGIKTDALSGEADKSSIPALREGRGSALTDSTLPELGSFVNPSFSLTTKAEQARLDEALQRHLNRSPEARLAVYERMRANLDRVIARNNASMLALRDGRDYQISEAEQNAETDRASRIADLHAEEQREIQDALDANAAKFMGKIEGASPSEKRSINAQAKDRAAIIEKGIRSKYDEKIKAIENEAQIQKPAADGQEKYAKMIQSVGELEAVIKALPMEIRGKIGGYREILSKSTDKGRTSVLLKRIEMADKALEKLLRDGYDEQLTKILNRSTPKKNEPGEKPKGIGAGIQRLFSTLKEAKAWKPEEITSHITMLEDRLDSGEMTPEEEAHARKEIGLVQLVGNWKDADSVRRNIAVKALKNEWEKGYSEYMTRILQKRERNARTVTSLRDQTGKEGTAVERQNKVLQDNGLAGWFTGAKSKAKSVMYGILSFDQVLHSVFGDKSAEANQIADLERKASNAKEDSLHDKMNQLRDFFTSLAGGDEFKGRQKQWEMAQPTTEVPGSALEGAKWSQNQLLAATMMWMQEDGRRHMEGRFDENGKRTSSWGYTQADIDKIEASLTPESKALREYLLEKYASEWHEINSVYKELNGVDLPNNKDYSPLTVKPQNAPGGQVTDPETGMSFSGRGTTPGSLRTRGSSIAEPDFHDVLQTYISHTKKMEHYKAYAPFIDQVSTILRNRELRNSIEAAGGKEAAKALSLWMDYHAQGGTRDAASGLAIYQGLNKGFSRLAQMAIVGHMGIPLLHSLNLGSALSEMPTGAYVKRLAMLFSGQLSWIPALKSEYIQRRIAEMPEIAKQAMQGLDSEKPTLVREAVRKMGHILPAVDGFFTAGVYAMTYDYHLGQAKELGLTGQAAEEYARTTAERATDRLSIPTRSGAKSLFENTTTNPIVRSAYAFMSIGRKNIALTAYSMAHRSAADTARTVAYMLILNGLGAAVIRSAWQDAKDDEENGYGSRKHWDAKKLALAALTEPLMALPVIGPMINAGLEKVAGEHSSPHNLWDMTGGIGAAFHLKDDATGKRDMHQMLADGEKILTTMGLFNSELASFASLGNLAKDAFGIGHKAEKTTTGGK